MEVKEGTKHGVSLPSATLGQLYEGSGLKVTFTGLGVGVPLFTSETDGNKLSPRYASHTQAQLGPSGAAETESILGAVVHRVQYGTQRVIAPRGEVLSKL